MTWLECLGLTEADANRILAKARMDPDDALVQSATIVDVHAHGYFTRKRLARVERTGYFGQRLDSLMIEVP